MLETCGYTAQEAAERRVDELVMAVEYMIGIAFTGDIDLETAVQPMSMQSISASSYNERALQSDSKAQP